MTNIRIEHRHLDVACELEAAGATDRAEEWNRLRTRWGLGSELIPGGARLWLRAGGSGPAEDLVRRESACCGFMDLEVAAEGDRVYVEITSLAPEAAPVIAWLAGLEDTGVLPCC